MANNEAADRLYDALRGTRIPDYMWDGLVAYITEGRPTGGFLQAIFSNNLKEACSKADGENQGIIYDYVHFLFNNAPSACWGSPERVAQWREIVKAGR
ncbi:MAG: hypothetical protein ACHQX3_00985 [Nitrospirales bacterium]